MSIPLIINGVTYNFPQPFDTNWAPAVDAWAVAVTNGLLQKAGGSFPLASEVDFGNSFGIRVKYVKSEESNIATTGFFRLANASPGVGWRNAANSADLLLTVNSSDQITFNGVPFLPLATLTDNHIYLGNASNQPAMVTLSGDATTSNTGVLTIANGAINNAKVASGAAIAVNKLAALTPSELVVTDGSGFISSQASPSLTEIGYVAGVTSSIQTQINNITGSSVFTSGDMKAAAYTAVPTGWLLCDGTSYATVTYPALFAAIGYVYGGVGANFNVPNMVNAVPIGAGSTAAMGVTAGANTATVSITDTGHNHTQNAHQHIGTSGENGGALTVGTTADWPFGSSSATSATVRAAGTFQPHGGVGINLTSSVTATNNTATTGITATNPTVQPSLGVTWFIKI